MKPCQCLAMWVDSEPCICDEPIGAPMEVSAAKLETANRLVQQVREIDRALAAITKDKDTTRTCRTIIWTGTDYDPRVEVRLPHDLAAGVLRTMRFQTLIKLAETGVVSTWSGHRPVVSA